jgi:hypothetical protein
MTLDGMSHREHKPEAPAKAALGPSLALQACVAGRHYLAARAAEEMSAWAGPRAAAMSERVARHIVSLTG